MQKTRNFPPLPSTSVGVKEEDGEGYPPPHPIPLPIRLEGLGERRELPQRPKMKMVHLICHRTLLAEGKTMFIDNYSGTNKQINMNQLKSTN